VRAKGAVPHHRRAGFRLLRSGEIRCRMPSIWRLSRSNAARSIANE